MTKLPIEQILPALQAALSTQNNAVLVAEPGAGKTTRVPLALLNEPWLQNRRLLMLEPRRLAARTAARYMAALLGEEVGQTVGYRVRRDTRIGLATRIEVITEGVLTRLLQNDPGLENVGAVIFDEFHERSIQADLGLALCLESQSVLRPDLRMLIMSATLEVDPLAKILGNAPVITSTGRSYPVETYYLDQPGGGERIESVVAQTVSKALNAPAGDILVFLPGVGEIRRVEAALAQCTHAPVTVAPLYGNLPLEAQDRAIAPSRPGRRKIVLATSIAETSLTVEGIAIVIDSGLTRMPRFSPRTGMTRLETVRVSRASADQRRGRAGRQGPGICYRLWSRHEDRHLVAHRTPEILEADLAPLALELAVWGAKDPAALSWLDVPPAAAFAQARELLVQLGALGADGTVTFHGRQMAESGLHPRLAHMILTAIPAGLGGLACELAALMSERDILKGDGRQPEADLRLRVDALRQCGAGNYLTAAHAGYHVDSDLCRRIALDADFLKDHFGVVPERDDDGEACGRLLAFAYPDRIAQLRSTGRFLLRNGRGAILSQHQSLAEQPYLVAAELDDQGAESRIYLAAPVDKSDLERFFAGQIVENIDVSWDSKVQAVRGRAFRQLGAIILQEWQFSDIDREQCQTALITGIKNEGLTILPWTKTAVRLQQRMAFIHGIQEDWPDVSHESLEQNLAEWLGPYLYDVRSRADLQQLNLTEILGAMLTWKQRQELDEQAPAHLVVPSGQRIAIDYSNAAAPVLAVRLQEMFGLTATPCIAGGKVALTLHLLSPAYRPVQVTKDLASFWRTAYFDVKKDLAGRYPKHHWPDDPLAASPTHRARPRA